MDRHRVVIVGGGSAGMSVAARLRRAGQRDVVLIEPSATHHYQPLWTLVGGGRAPVSASARPQSAVLPRGVRWVRGRATGIDPEAREVSLADGQVLDYDYLVVCPGIQLDWAAIPGLTDTLGRDGVSSNYTAELATRTWRFVRDLRSGTAVFAMPPGPIKCAGAPQKIAYLAADHWRRAGLLDRIEIHLVLPTPALFGIPEYGRVLGEVVRRYGITVHLSSEVTQVRADTRQLLVRDNTSGATTALPYDLAHLVPPQSAPDWLKGGPLTDPQDPAGWVQVDRHTLRHVRYANVFSLGDVCSAPTSKTGAAVRKQAPVVVANLLATMRGGTPVARYDGYASCPLTTARGKVVLAEFDYSMRPRPSFPLINTAKERTDMWYLKRHGLPWFYWNLMLRGVA
ncbi:FAD/NAD(P)-binding oxidoreductase [Kutzneria viridogrisea]|uniref:Sulfide:quinone oxidoreductase n=2 Tax=Kutzneria TaxID=43356 RepID=A0ABR6BZ55_9PSEU|nr:FAD/NAD(P)-binding oxidoreductase [Kutzneria albida]AHH97065.1 putative pyridine nucleotide-disulfide oxidoreductase [Kutzneria albida DSM 43870]MBA8931965.1 sulfide:quinone oxidoreductase [Kutzneria viridogrisea]